MSINIFIGLISNALQTEAFSTVEARFLLERIEVILNYEWRLSNRGRLQLQEIIHRQCAPLQLNWKEINFDAFGKTREEQNTKAFAAFRRTIEKHNIQFDTFRIQVQQKLSDIDATLSKAQPAPPAPAKIQKSAPPEIVVHKSTSDTPTIVEPSANLVEELGRLRELLEDTLAGQAEHSSHPGRPSTARSALRHRQHSTETLSTTVDAHQDTQVQVFSQNISERVTDLQLAVNRLHQDVTAIRQVLERISPLSTSLILGRAAGRK